jgi:hypothetical protein
VDAIWQHNPHRVNVCNIIIVVVVTNNKEFKTNDHSVLDGDGEWGMNHIQAVGYASSSDMLYPPPKVGALLPSCDGRRGRLLLACLLQVLLRVATSLGCVPLPAKKRKRNANIF